ncbi:NAD(P)/FAD-dependent oxidoreductase [Tistrella mobilis]|uniref:flavin-containing monooxygenase n=1 Tax=Tistrella mobilis TaxID=171437 RepID=UPI00355738ED
MNDRTVTPRARDMRVIIVGAGFGGLCMAIRLRQAGFKAVTILEKGEALGGTWRRNTYPGAGCDVPSHLYSFSFALKPDWSRTYARQPEILAYMEETADRFGLRPLIRFGTKVEAAAFDDQQGLWTIDLTGGGRLEAEVLISAVGQLDRPAVPEIPGRDSFAGLQFHSARWPAGLDLGGRRVGVVGNGSSAVQFIPEIAPAAGHLTLFQRSPAWIAPKPDRAYTEAEIMRFRRYPAALRLHRLGIFLSLEKNFLVFGRNGFARRRFERQALASLADRVADPMLRRRLTPDYPAGCKRIVLSNDWYDTLVRPGVEVVARRITRITPEGVETADGGRHALDVLIWATGFRTTEFLMPMRISGRGGIDLHEAWTGGAEAHRGVAVAGFPNFFMLFGPNTSLGHNSIIFMHEVQADYVVRCLQRLAGEGRSRPVMDVRPEAMGGYNRKLRAALDRTVWAAGCNSWYKTGEGRITAQWSSFASRYWWDMRGAPLDEYLFADAGEATGPGIAGAIIDRREHAVT